MKEGRKETKKEGKKKGKRKEKGRKVDGNDGSQGRKEEWKEGILQIRTSKEEGGRIG